MENEPEEISIEDGEIVDDDEEGVNYLPLKRPDNYSSIAGNVRFQKDLVESESEGDLQSSSSSDSDSGAEARKGKKPKLKPKLLHLPKEKRKKYDIWSNRVQEDVLLETMNRCDVTKKDRSRSIETYDYTLSYTYNKDRINNKRTRTERSDKNIRPVNKKTDEELKKCKPRKLLELTINESSTTAEIATEIANKLCEEKSDLINTIVTVVGREKAIGIFEKVRKIELEGGMLIMNQTRRRTPGGVYIFLIKHDNDLTSEQQLLIFGDEKEKYRQDQKLKKKLKRQQMKGKIALEKAAKDKKLSSLLTRAEQCMQDTASNDNGVREESDHDDVVNPPPTPETDGQETSGDSMDQHSNQNSDLRKIQNYEDDYLNINVENDMDLF